MQSGSACARTSSAGAAESDLPKSPVSVRSWTMQPSNNGESSLNRESRQEPDRGPMAIEFAKHTLRHRLAGTISKAIHRRPKVPGEPHCVVASMDPPRPHAGCYSV